MKKYIFLTTSVGNMGGAQMYIANKAQYLESYGWHSVAYCINNYPIIIDYPKSFTWKVIPEFNYSIISLCSKIRNNVIFEIAQDIGQDNEVVIECNYFPLAFWGELLAQKINSKNLVFILQESIPLLKKGEADFLNFKLARLELMNSTDKSLHNIFKSYYKPDYSEYKYNILPFCSNVISYKSVILPRWTYDSDYNILSIGRLDKPYIIPMLNQIHLFASHHKKLFFNLIFIGDDSTQKTTNIVHSLFRDIPNVSVHLLGYMFPIPIDWIKLADISIASSNSVKVSANEGVPTIAVDSHDFDAIGIYGYTTQNTYLRTDENRLLISDLLEEVLIQNSYAGSRLKPSNSDSLEDYFKPHMELLESSSKVVEYYNVVGIYSFSERLASVGKRILFPIYSPIRYLFTLASKETKND